jgi:hypothetical protein
MIFRPLGLIFGDIVNDPDCVFYGIHPWLTVTDVSYSDLGWERDGYAFTEVAVVCYNEVQERFITVVVDQPEGSVYVVKCRELVQE